MAIFRIKTGDTLPVLAVQVIDSNGDAYNLGGCTAKFIMAKFAGGTTKVNASANITSESDGYVEYRWTTDDTDTADRYEGEFQITTVNGKIFSVPVYPKLYIEIEQDMGD